jgi:hypothetical protein
MKDEIVQTGNGGFVASGPLSVSMVQLVALKGALRLEGLGLRRRGPSALSIAKRVTGLRTNDRERLTRALESKIEDISAQIALKNMVVNGTIQ